MTPDQAKHYSRYITLSSTVLLILLLTVVNITRPAFNLIVLFAQLIPLALTIPGQLTSSPRAFQWLCFADMFFLTQGILLAFTPGQLVTGLTEVLICLTLFFSAIIFIRASQRTS